ncbi:MAG: T9SS type A sorting domain-containing protein [Bacteroidota bacterium]
MKFLILNIFSVLLSVFFSLGLRGQAYTSWVVGDAADIATGNHQPGIVLAGGGGDNDDAMRWMLQRAGGGDVVVLRASGEDGYNEYFFSELGVSINSVETIRFDNAAAASDPYVVQQINNAEILFIAGGDQYVYYQYWKDNEIENTINHLINEKKITVGGTSAGMAILGNAYYTPPGGSAQSATVLQNPFHPNVDLLGQNDFIENPYLPLLITDTHFDDRDRAGRLMVFLARLSQENNGRVFAIACNEYTAVGINENGEAKVFGDHPEYPDFAYFLEVNCESDFLPETLVDGQPLTWDNNGTAVKAYRIPGTADGSNQFNTLDWEPVGGGEWFDWYVQNGVLFQNGDAEPGCGLISDLIEIKKELNIEIKPTLVSSSFFVEIKSPVFSTNIIQVFDLLGRELFFEKMENNFSEINISAFNSGIYLVKIVSGEKIFSEVVFKD